MRYIPRRLMVSVSTLDRMTVECISQPLSLESYRSAVAAVSFSAAELDSAMRISSV